MLYSSGAVNTYSVWQRVQEEEGITVGNYDSTFTNMECRELANAFELAQCLTIFAAAISTYKERWKYLTLLMKIKRLLYAPLATHVYY